MSSVRLRRTPLAVRLHFGALTCLSLSFSLPAGADDANPDAAQPVQAVPLAQPVQATQLDAVRITAEQPNPYTVSDTAAATKLPLTLRETPQSVTVVTRERIDDQNLQSLRDVLDNSSGVYSYAYDSERVVFTSRGFVIDSLLYDGVPAATNFNTDSIDETLDTALYQRIEIVRGATGLLSGAGSPSASVNLVRKHADARAPEAELSFDYGSWNDKRGVVDASTPLNSDGSVRARVIGVYQSRESYQDLYKNDKKVFYGVIDADLTPHTLVSLGYDYQETKPTSNTWGSFPLFFSDGTRTDWNRSVTTATDWSFWNKRKQTVFAEARHDFDGGWSLRSTLSYRKADEDLALFYMYGFPDRDSGEGLIPYAYRSSGKVDQTSVDLYASGPFQAFGRQHELVIGYNGSRVHETAREAPHGDLPDPGNFLNWDGSYPEPVFGDSVQIADINSREQSLYAAARLSLADPLKLIVGTRYNAVKVDYFYIYTSADPFNHDHHKAVPYAGLVYDLTTHFSAFTSYTGIFNPQNARRVDGSYLDPVVGKSIEAGIKGEHFDGRFNTALTVFRTQQDHVAVPLYDADGNPVNIPGTLTQASYEVNGTHTQGLELEASGAPLPGWNLSFGWSRYLLEDGDGQSIKSYIPRTLVRAFSTWNPSGALAALTVGGGVNWQSSSNLDVGAPSGLSNIRQGSVTLLSMLARYQLTPGLSLQLNGGNLLDRKYYVLDEYGNLYFGTPRNATVGAKYQFGAAGT